MAKTEKKHMEKKLPVKESTLHGRDHKGYVDPGWPTNIPEGGHAVTELVADTAGALSPYGDLEFPVDPSTLSYVHPDTRINGKYGY